ncbi:MAG: hypothetical protein HY390_03610 [Deltaproteobacteria bacterium]|nr:hypothetical protein [Deltaproteobacteria bacterium]
MKKNIFSIFLGLFLCSTYSMAENHFRGEEVEHFFGTYILFEGNASFCPMKLEMPPLFENDQSSLSGVKLSGNLVDCIVKDQNSPFLHQFDLFKNINAGPRVEIVRQSNILHKTKVSLYGKEVLSKEYVRFLRNTSERVQKTDVYLTQEGVRYSYVVLDYLNPTQSHYWACDYEKESDAERH